MKKTRHLLLLISLSLIAAANPMRGTTVIPPTFDELVDQADFIFQGEVTTVKSEWIGEGAQRHIMSYVTFKVGDAIKGSPGQNYTIRMLGGTVDGESMGVSDAPKFEVGDQDILFVQNNGSQFIPLVGIMHGRFHVRRNEGGQEIVTNHEDEPVRNLARLGNPNAVELPNENDLTPAEFKAAVRSRIESSSRAQQSN
ncbi:MAG TPA: hypothetical protein VEI58_07140 [Chthoniobacterales bacterium]|nr:hypothetical protein [Chthoniobacterales bacterium]